MTVNFPPYLVGLTRSEATVAIAIFQMVHQHHAGPILPRCQTLPASGVKSVHLVTGDTAFLVWTAFAARKRDWR